MYPTALGSGHHSSVGPMLQSLRERLYELELSVFEEQPAWMAEAVVLAPEDLQRRVGSVVRMEGLPLGVRIGPPVPLHPFSRIQVLLDNIPRTDYPQVEFESLDGAQDLEVVATGQSKIHSHTAVANVIIVWEKGNNVQGVRSYMGDFN